MHTALQARLLEEMYNLIPDNSQLWLSTHSIGMLEKAKELEELYPNTVCFLDFSDIDFDTPQTIKPSSINSTIWNKFLELAFGDFAKLIVPKTLVLCEGAIDEYGNKGFDAQIYGKIFSSKHPDTSFVSVGSCNDIEKVDSMSMKIIKSVLTNTTIIKIIDCDDRSDGEIDDLKKKGIKVLNRRNIESYLLDDEIIEKLCRKNNQEDKIGECLQAKMNALECSVNRGNPADDLKSASGDLYNALKRILSLTRCGNAPKTFFRDTIAPLITEDTHVYKVLEEEIFGVEPL